MPTPFPPRADLFPAGLLPPAEFKVELAKFFDASVALLGMDGEPATARGLLGVAPRATRIDVASVAGTVNLTTAAPDTDDIRITGALAITAFTIAVGRVVRFVAGGAASLANNASIVTNTGATVTFAAGDSGVLRATAADVVELISFTRAAIPLPLTSGTLTTTTSGTSKPVTGLPTTMRKLAISLAGVSFTSTDNVQLRVGPTAGVVNSGYDTNVAYTIGGYSSYTDSFRTVGTTAGNSWKGTLTLVLEDPATNTWVCNGMLSCADAHCSISGSISLAGPLTRFEIAGGSGNTFDAGSFNYMYE